MKFPLTRFLLPLALLLTAAGPAHAHRFTDDQGRKVEAELVGLRGDHVVLAVQNVRGQWPLARLSAADQAYVRQWQTSHTAVKSVTVLAQQREGIGATGLADKKTSSDAAEALAPLKDLPIPSFKEESHRYSHFEITVANPSPFDATQLKVAYVLYVVHPDGSVGISPGVQTVKSLPTGQSARLITEGVTATQTKMTKLRVSVVNESLSVKEKTERSREQAGGVWVRVSGPDGQMIGETKRFSRPLEKLNPPWEEAEVAEDIPILPSLDGLLELLKNALPPLPPEGSRPGLPPLPPGLPR